MPRFILSAICLAGLAVPAFAAPPENSLVPTSSPTGPASMNPAPAASGQKPDSTGLGDMTKDRPKDAKTEITSKTDATFDNASNIAEFNGSVVVKDPQFTLFCDKLTVTLNKERKGMELAVASGNVIIVQESKPDSNGKVTKAIGRSGKAVYQPQTGDITLTIWPSMQQGVNLQKATEEGAIMVLNRSGKNSTTGATQTWIIQTDDQNNNQSADQSKKPL